MLSYRAVFVKRAALLGGAFVWAVGGIPDYAFVAFFMDPECKPG